MEIEYFGEIIVVDFIELDEKDLSEQSFKVHVVDPYFENSILRGWLK